MGANKKKYLMYICAYTALVTAVFWFGYRAFFENGKSFMWYDGYVQHYPALVYLGSYFRGIITNFLSGHFTIPMFNFNVGMGENIIAMLNLFDGYGDPLMLLSTFVPVKYSEVLYNALVILRMYLAGISFSIFCFYMKKPRSHVLIGAIIYVFCGYALYAGVRHPSFITPMIYFPIMLIGIDRIVNKKKPYLFIITVFIAAMNGFYFLYITTIFVCIFVLIRFFNIYKENKIKELTHTICQFALSYIIGILMAAVIFLPAVFGFLSSTRSDSSVQVGNLLFYDVTYYFGVLLKAVSPSMSCKYLSLAALPIFAVVILIMRRDQHYRQIKQAFIIGLLFLLIPFGGYLTNGFSYVSGRWTFIFSFLLSFIVVCILPIVQKLRKKEKWACLILILIYGIIRLVHPLVRDMNSILGFTMLAVSFSVILLIQNDSLNRFIKILSQVFKIPKLVTDSKISENSYIFKRTGVVMCCVLVTVNLIFNADYLFSEDKNDYISQFKDIGETLDAYVNSEVAAALPLPDNEFYRLDSTNRSVQNSSMVLNYPSVSVYFSIVNSNVATALNALEDSQLNQAYNLYGFDNRSAIDTLACVKYISIEDGKNEEYVPFGFAAAHKKVQNNKTYTIYENQYALPLGYTYSSYITEDEFGTMSALEKQEAMLQAIVLSEKNELYSYANTKSTVQTTDYSITKMDGVTWDKGNLVVEKENATITIAFAGLPNSETYLRLNNLNIDDSDSQSFYMDIMSGKVTKICRVMAKSFKFGLGRKDYLVNLGYSIEGKTSATINFRRIGTFKLDDIEVYNQPMDAYVDQVKALGEEPLENIEVTNNKVTGSVDLSSNKILNISIGYSNGWSAKVDGEEVEILKANGMFMAIPLTKGYHEIELNYNTPGIKTGIILSLAGFLAFVCLIVLRETRARG